MDSKLSEIRAEKIKSLLLLKALVGNRHIYNEYNKTPFPKIYAKIVDIMDNYEQQIRLLQEKLDKISKDKDTIACELCKN